MDLLVVPGVDPFDAMVQTAAKLQASRLVTGVSPRWIPRSWRAGSAWHGRSCRSRGIRFRSKIITPGRPSVYVNLGPHPPRLWPEDLDRAHELWLRLTGASSARGCTIATSSAWRCAGWRRTSRTSATREVLDDLERELKKP